MIQKIRYFIFYCHRGVSDNLYSGIGLVPADLHISHSQSQADNHLATLGCHMSVLNKASGMSKCSPKYRSINLLPTTSRLHILIARPHAMWCYLLRLSVMLERMLMLMVRRRCQGPSGKGQGCCSIRPPHLSRCDLHSV